MELKDFGTDHWSTFAYAETCCVDNHSSLDLRRLRVNEVKRPIRSNGFGWKPENATRIKGGCIPDPDHDDIDCLDDLEKAGLLEWIGTLINPAIKLTEKGVKVTSQLRKPKSYGGQFGTFVPAM